MIFSRGETWGHYEDRIGQWHLWFAWHPVPLKPVEGFGRSAWLERVERRGKLLCLFGECWETWEYREIEDAC